MPQVDRAKDLLIPVEFDARYDYDFSGAIETDEPGAPAFFRFVPAKDEADLAARLIDPDTPKNQAYLLPVEKLLVIPKTILAGLQAGDNKMGIGVEQRLFKPRSADPVNSVRSAALTYKYGFEFNLKFK